MFLFQQDNSANQLVKKVVEADSLKKTTSADKSPVNKNMLQSTPEVNQIVASDSIQAKDTIIAEPAVVSLFAGHELKPLNIRPIEKSDFNPAWITIFLIGSLVVAAYLRATYPKRFGDFFKAVVDKRFASQLAREEKVLSQRISIFLIIVFVFSASTFLFILHGFFNSQIFSGAGILLFSKIALSVFLLFLFRVFVAETVGFIFNAEHEFSFYNFHIFLFNKALGIAMIPVIAGLAYVTIFPQVIFIYLGISLFIISFIARLIRGLNIGFAKQGFNKFYLFFYFCTLEILPAVILVKILLNQ